MNDLSATDVKNIVLDLANDAAVDTTTINGTGRNDTITIAPNQGAVDVTGLAAVKIEHPEAANDLLNVNGLDATTSLRRSRPGSTDQGRDRRRGRGRHDQRRRRHRVPARRRRDDAIDGNGGADTALMGAGDDTFVWDPGDGSDVVEGQDGADTMLFNGAGVGENFDVSANGNRLRFFRTQGAITMDLNDTEFIDVQALGGADNAVVNDVTGTDLKRVAFDLEARSAAEQATAPPTRSRSTARTSPTTSRSPRPGVPTSTGFPRPSRSTTPRPPTTS